MKDRSLREAAWTEEMGVSGRVLVAYSSRTGSTAQVAHMIGRAFPARGIAVDVVPARRVESLDGYEFVVLGSAIYGGHWRPEVMRLMRRHRHQLALRQVWLFQTGLAVLRGGRSIDPTPAAVRELAGAAVGPVTFPARLARPGLRPRLMPSQEALLAQRRDWDRVRRWAAGVALQVDVGRAASANDRPGGLRRA